MAKFPEPPQPQQLARLAPQLQALPAGTPLWRLYLLSSEPPREWYSFRAYGPVTNARFDHHLPPPREQERRIYYAASEGPTCLAEIFQDTRVIDTTHPSWRLVGFETARDLRLLDLTCNWPTAAGASMTINSGSRARARRWSQTFYDAYPQIDGLWYCSSMDANRPCVALYERAADSLPHLPFFHASLSDPSLRTALENAAHRFGYSLV